MSIPDYYGQQPVYYGNQPVILPHRGGLTGWGTVLIVFGSLAGLLAVLGLIGLAISSAFAGPQPGGRQTAAVGAVLIGVLIESATSAGLIWTGIAALRGRRWVGPLVSALSILVIASSSVAVINSVQVGSHALKLPTTATAGTPFPEKYFALGVAIGGAVVTIGLGVVLPLFMLRFFNRDTLRQTLAAMDPRPRWTDRMPLPLLVWIIGCVVGGSSLAVSAAAGVIPFFFGILQGLSAVIVSLFLGGFMVAGGLLCLGRSTMGWLMSLAVMALVAASMSAFAAAGDWEAYRQTLSRGMPAAQQQTTADMLPDHLMASTALLYIAAVIYGIWIGRRLKDEPPAAPVETLPDPKLPEIRALD